MVWASRGKSMLWPEEFRAQMPERLAYVVAEAFRVTVALTVVPLTDAPSPELV
jgi:hypothetical protein